MFADCQSFVGVSSNERVENKRQIARYRFCWSFYVIFTIATHVSRKPHFRAISSTILAAYMCSFVFAVPVVGSDLRALPRGRALGYFVVTRLRPTSFSRCVNDRTKNTDRDICGGSHHCVGLPESIRFYLERILPFDISKIKAMKKWKLHQTFKQKKLLDIFNIESLRKLRLKHI